MAQVVFGQVIQAKYFDYTEVLVAVLLLFLCSQGLGHRFMLVLTSLIWKRVQFPVLFASGTCSYLQGLGVELGKHFFTCLDFHQVKLEILACIFHVVKDPALCFHSNSVCMRQLLCWLCLFSSHCLPSAG